MDFVLTLVDLFLHLDDHLTRVIQLFGVWTYLILFLVIFLETGVVITPFLPGDSLLFAAGALAATGAMDVAVLFGLLSTAAILGDTVNYWIGHTVGPRVFSQRVRFLNPEYLERTRRFYERHGGKTIVLARFVPIVRTFAPFVAGIGSMSYPRFVAYNVFGALLWNSIFVFGGYFFGNLPFVRDNFSLVVVAIVLISVLPAGVEAMRERWRRAQRAPSA